MYIIRDFFDVPAQLRGGVVAIGNFDGLHLGHMAVIDQMKQIAKATNGPTAIMTFEPHPRRYFNPNKQRSRVIPFHHKVRLLKAVGIDLVLAQRFNQSFSQLPAHDFVERVLIGALGARHVVTGDDFIFGYKRSGNVELLHDYANQGAFGYTAIEAVGEGQNGYSSSIIRQHIAAGEVGRAAAILGRPYDWIGRVVHGDKRGRTIGFPTANMVPVPVLLPQFGVYAVRAQLYDVPNAPMMPGVANLGTRPTVDGECPLLEVHLFDNEIDLYSKRLRVEFTSFIRPEQRFEGIDALQAQITQDCQNARKLLA